jgi:hypothetical protein
MGLLTVTTPCGQCVHPYAQRRRAHELQIGVSEKSCPEPSRSSSKASPEDVTGASSRRDSAAILSPPGLLIAKPSSPNGPCSRSILY